MVLLMLLWNEQEMGNMPFASWVKATMWHKVLHISVLSKLFSVINKHTWLSLSLLLLKKGSFLEKHDQLCPAGWVLSVLRRWGLYCSEQQWQNIFLWWTWDSFPLTAGFVFSFLGSCCLFEACLASSIWFFPFSCRFHWLLDLSFSTCHPEENWTWKDNIRNKLNIVSNGIDPIKNKQKQNHKKIPKPPRRAKQALWNTSDVLRVHRRRGL